MGETQLVSNQEIFKELRTDVRSLRSEIQEVRSELRGTRKDMKQYNDLRKDLAECIEDVQEIKNRRQAQTDLLDKIRSWSGWIVTIIVFLATYFTLRR